MYPMLREDVSFMIRRRKNSDRLRYFIKNGDGITVFVRRCDHMKRFRHNDTAFHYSSEASMFISSL